MSVTTIAISGCGAVTHHYYLPALEARRDRLNVVGFHDPDTARASAMAGRFPGSASFGTMDALLALKPDLVVVASPPAAHADQTISALRHGAHVLCEKPMALTLADSTAMAGTADEHDRLLAIGMVRRHFPCSQIVERLIGGGRLGALRSVAVFEGGAFHWPIGDQRYFTREVSGGGVLADVGVHVLDLLFHWLGQAELVAYEDDEMGGVETNARLTLRFGEAEGVVRMSRDWDRPNLIDLRFEQGSVQWRADDLAAVTLLLEDDPKPLRVVDETATSISFIDCIGRQLDAIIDHLAGKPARIVRAANALPVVELIERAYRERRPMDMPWLAPVGMAAHG